MAMYINENEECYFRGDKARPTGQTDGEYVEFIWVEGNSKGKTFVQMDEHLIRIKKG